MQRLKAFIHAVGMKLQLGGWGAYSVFAVFVVVSLYNKIYSVVRNTYHSSASCFIIFINKNEGNFTLFIF